MQFRVEKRTTLVILIAAVLLLTAMAPAATVNCSGVAAWSGNSVAYAVGQLVTYNGSEYKCIQAHTSQAGWDPADVPALWGLQGTCTTGATPTPTAKPTATATAKPTATPTPKPTATPTPKPTATPTPTPGQVTTGSVEISCGGPAASPFIADADFSGGNVASTSASIATTFVSAPVPPQLVFQHERWGAMTYTIGGFTPGSTATVNLYFAEIYWTAAGQRQFNVLINGAQVLTNFDVFAATGGENIGIQENFSTPVNSSGQVVIQFTVGAADQPKISGIIVTAQTSGPAPTPTPTPKTTPTPGNTPTPVPPPPGGTHGRLRIISGCSSQPMWVQWLLGNGGGTLNAPNFVKLSSVGASTTFQIPDTGLAGLRVWPGFGCDANGQNCTIGASGGPASDGFTCPAGIGCAPPIDSKFEGSFGCIAGAGTCLQNPSGGGALGPLDWWDASFVDGYTVPIKVVVNGSCPAGPQSNGPGGPPNGIFDCSALKLSSCPTSENLSTNGEFPALANESLVLHYPNANGTPSGTVAGCFSPASKLTSGQWQSIPNPPFTGTTYNPSDAQAQMYACPTPPISSQQCSSGPAASTNYTKMIHSTCNAYAYAYDDTIGLSTCPAATNLEYDVTFYCPQ